MPRSSAIFAALARGDMSEADRLTDTAPHIHYTGADFIPLFQQSLMVAATAALNIERAHKRYMAARAVITIAAYRQQEGDDALILDAERRKDEHQTSAQAVWAAYAQAIAEAGLDPKETIRAVWSFDDASQGLLADEAEPGAETLELFRFILRKGTN